MSWQVLIFLSVLSGSIGEIGQKISVSSKQNLKSETVNFLVASLQLFFSILFVVVTNQKLDTQLSSNQIFLVVISSLLGFFFFKFLYQSYKGNSASVSQIIFSFSAVISSIIGIVAFRESSTIQKFIGIFLILFALGIVTFSRSERLRKSNIYALIAALIFAVITNIDKSFSIEINIHWYQVISVFAFIIVSVLLGFKAIFSDLKNIKTEDFKSILISAISFTIFNKLTYLAFLKGAEVGRVDALNNTTVFLIIFFEYFLLKDRKNLLKKIVGSAFAIAGVVLLT